MNEDEILKKLTNSEIKLYDIEKFIDKESSVRIRRKYIEKLISGDLKGLSEYPQDAEKIYGRNCENLVGSVSLPLGVAGPVRVLGNNAFGEYLLPLATTEGALVASVNRGAKLISMLGGCRVVSKYVGITRAPLFKLPSLDESYKFVDWFENNKSEIFEIGENTDKYLKVIGATTHINGRYVWIRFSFNTSDAMGMNMAVVATKAMSEMMEEKFEGLDTLSISGNMCVDKKPAAINQIEGRGRTVEAEIVIPEDVLMNKYSVSAERLVEVNKGKIWLGGYMSGSFGFNAHHANMIASIYISTGQDPAQVVEGSMGSTNIEKFEDSVVVNVRIPCLNIATFGGGTGLSTQKECQSIILTNIAEDISEDENPNNSGKIDQTQKLAEIIGAGVLAGEISLQIAFANRGFVKAHTEYGRNGGN